MFQVTIIEKMLTAPRALRDAAEEAAEQALRGEPEPLLASQARAARMLDCSRFTVRRMTKDGTLKPVMLRGLARYRISDIKKLVEG